MNTIQRQSNFELLRILCMFLIVWVHLTQAILGSQVCAGMQTWEMVLLYVIHGICWCAVNTFILISGYFSIRPKAKSFFNFYLTCAFYAGILYVIHLYFIGSHLNRWVIYNTLMPFGLWQSSTGWWFIPNYLILYILSPIINKAIDGMSKHEFQFSLLGLGVIVFYFGWYRNMTWSEMGFNFINFIFLYFIGRYIAIYSDAANGAKWRRGGGFAWVAAGSLLGYIDWWGRMNRPMQSWMWFNGQYNSPLSIIAAIALFVTFRNIRMGNNKFINWFAASALSIYLVHNNEYYLSKKLYECVSEIYQQYSPLIAYAVLMVIAILLVIIIPVVDKIRVIITTPISDFLCQAWSNISRRMIKNEK